MIFPELSIAASAAIKIAARINSGRPTLYSQASCAFLLIMNDIYASTENIAINADTGAGVRRRAGKTEQSHATIKAPTT